MRFEPLILPTLGEMASFQFTKMNKIFKSILNAEKFFLKSSWLLSNFCYLNGNMPVSDILELKFQFQIIEFTSKDMKEVLNF